MQVEGDVTRKPNSDAVSSLEEYLKREPMSSEEILFKLSSSKVIWANRDYFSSIGIHKSEDIDRVLKGAALISSSQLEQGSQFREEARIQVEEDQVTCVRPPSYGRAVIHCAGLKNATDYGILFDVKGVGLPPGFRPTEKFHATGTLLMHFAIEEIIKQKIIDECMRVNGINVKGVPLIGLVDCGYKSKYVTDDNRIERRTLVRCVLLIREARIRPPNKLNASESGTDEFNVKLKTELTIRKFGITSCSGEVIFQRCNGQVEVTFDNGIKRVVDSSSRVLPPAVLAMDDNKALIYEPVNIQITNAYQLAPFCVTLIDFGHYRFEKQFDKDVMMMVTDRPLNWGGSISHSSKHWVQPTKNLKLIEHLSNPYPKKLVTGKAGPDLYDIELSRNRTTRMATFSSACVMHYEQGMDIQSVIDEEIFHCFKMIEAR